MKSALLAISALACICVGITQGSFDYCSLGRDHTLCQYQGVSPQCPKLISSGLSPAAQKAILDKHNQLRRKVANGKQKGQPSAANMREMVWDSELAKIAQRWAEQCISGHDRNRRKSDGTSVGQNYAMSGTTAQLNQRMMEKSAVDGVQNWYNEVKIFNPNTINPFRFSPGIGHYSQVVWASSYQIGCGFVAYQKGRFNQMITICNYAPAGNMIGGTMYIKGRACSKCPKGTKCNNGLCA